MSAESPSPLHTAKALERAIERLDYLQSLELVQSLVAMLEKDEKKILQPAEYCP